MNALRHLILWQLRGARAALCAGAFLGALILAGVQMYFPAPAANAQAAALTVALLTALWSVYFAADALASDRASGHLATLALLPVAPWQLWLARSLYAGSAALLQLAWLLGFELALQATVGSAATWAHFEAGLTDLAGWIPLGLFVVSATFFVSNLVENALAALLIALVAVGGLLALASGLVSQVAFVVSLLPQAVGSPWVLGAGGALLLWGVAGLAFARGQRRLGSRNVRLCWALTPLLMLLLGTTAASALAVRQRWNVDLESPDLLYFGLTSSADGRFLALTVGRERQSRQDPPFAVWLLDVDSGARTLAAHPGHLLGARFNGRPALWNDSQPLYVLQADYGDVSQEGKAPVTRVSLDGATLQLEALGETSVLDLVREIPHSSMQAWAEVESQREHSDRTTTTVRWPERGLEACFVDPEQAYLVAWRVLPTPQPGLILVHERDRIVQFNLEDGEEQLLLPADAATSLDPSDGGSGALVRGQQFTYAIDTASGDFLHEPWNNRQWSVSWIRSGDGLRVVSLRPVKQATGPILILDLDTQRSCLVETINYPSVFSRLGPRGYVFVRPDGDLVWVDLNGDLVKVLVDR